MSIAEAQMQRRIAVLCLVMLQMAVSSCSDRSLGSARDRSTPAKVFPIATGNQWVYERSDSLTSSVDTLELDVANSWLTIHGDSGYEITTTSASAIDTQFAMLLPDTLILLSSPEPPSLVLDRFVEPFTVGATWLASDAFDTVLVTAVESVNVPAGQFPSAVRLERARSVFNQDDLVTYWLVDTVGIVKKHVFRAGFERNEDYVLELLNYSLQ